MRHVEPGIDAPCRPANATGDKPAIGIAVLGMLDLGHLGAPLPADGARHLDEDARSDLDRPDTFEGRRGRISELVVERSA